MAAEPEDELLTIADASRILKVSPITVQRWIAQGRLPAYRLGPRYLRVRRDDLSKLLVPNPTKERNPGASHPPVPISVETPGEEEVQRRLEAIERSAALVARIRARTEGKLSPSWELIRRAREDRSTRT